MSLNIKTPQSSLVDDIIEWTNLTKYSMMKKAEDMKSWKTMACLPSAKEEETIIQLPKLCVKIGILRHRHMWVRSFSTRLTSVTFAEDKVLIFLILRKNAKIVQL